MNNYEDWAQLVAKKLQGEAEIIAAIDKEELDDAAATDAFARAVLEPFLPENFGIGSGRVVDAFGNYSEQLDLIIYNRDFPRIGMRGVHATYLYESVLACFAIRAKFVRKTFFDSLDSCASLAGLKTNVDQQVMARLAAKNGMKVGPNNTFIHDDPLRSARFELIGRPPAFVFGFSGFKYSFRQLQENLELWLEHRRDEGLPTPMKAFPGVIATQGCFAWRNAAPLALSNREMLGIGADDAPIRLIVLQLLYLLNRRLNVTSDGYGLKPNLKAYLNQFAEPKFELGIGDIAELTRINKASAARRQELDSEAERAARDTGRFESARDHAPDDEGKQGAPAKAEPTPGRSSATPDKPASRAVKPAMAEKPDEVEKSVKTEPSRAPAPRYPGSAPAPTFQTRPNAPPLGAAPIPNSSGRPVSPPLGAAPIPNSGGRPVSPPLGSAPIPPKQDRPPVAPPLGSAPIPPKQNKPSAPSLGSAPIPPMHKSNDAGNRTEAEATRRKPTVDIDIGAESAAVDAAEEDVLANTVIIPPPDGNKPVKSTAASVDKPRTSTNDFIARVKQQLANSEPLPDNEQDFTSTIPQ